MNSQEKTVNQGIIVAPDFTLRTNCAAEKVPNNEGVLMGHEESLVRLGNRNALRLYNATDEGALQFPIFAMASSESPASVALMANPMRVRCLP